MSPMKPEEDPESKRDRATVKMFFYPFLNHVTKATFETFKLTNQQDRASAVCNNMADP